MDNRFRDYAGFWLRAGAFALDYLLILVYLIVLSLILLIFRQFGNGVEWLFADRLRAQVTGILILTLPVILYFALGESSARQATWGKQRLNLRVTDQHGNRIHFMRALARTLLKFIPWEISHTLIWEISFSAGASSVLINYGFVLVYLLIGLNLAGLVLTKTRRTLYDYLAGTCVVKNNS
jgi:uncharacterized RDD family membrane protein YckC